MLKAGYNHMDVSVKPPPADVVDLLLRAFPPAAESDRVCRPFVASVVAVNDEGDSAEAVSSIVDSVTSSEAHLLHSRPLAGKRLELCVAVSGGEILRLVVEVVSTTSRGPLVETTARFLH